MKHFLFDLDGTVYRGNTGISTAVEFIHKLQSIGLEPFYVTNNSSKTREQLQLKLQSIGIEAPLSHIYSSALATVKYVQANFTNAKVRVVGADGIRSAFKNASIPVYDEGPVDVVVMGIDRETNYTKLANLCLTVQQGATLIGTNEDLRFPTEEGFVPGNGSFVKLVAQVANVKPIFIGKPSPMMLEMIAEDHGLKREDMIMVGDNYDTDILCGIRFGCKTLHVNTGVTPTEEAKKKESAPTICVETLEQFDLI